MDGMVNHLNELNQIPDNFCAFSEHRALMFSPHEDVLNVSVQPSD